jgi:hypothetical protein
VNRELRLSFRRTFSAEMMQVSSDLCAVMEQVNLNEDCLVLYKKWGVLIPVCYAVISFRDVTPVHIPAIWNIVVPQKNHLFLWLLSHNKLATVDNLNRKGFSKPNQCCFCSEDDSVMHLFFQCVVAKIIWKLDSDIIGCEIGGDYLSVASRWIHKKKCYAMNIFTTAVLRGVWLTRNEMVFNNQVWSDVRSVLRRILRLLLEWKPIFKEENLKVMMN